MYNADISDRAQLPSGKQLVVATFAAATVASLLLITTVLPAEFGIDPTGAGRVLGLTRMGEIKNSLAEEAAEDAATTVSKAISVPPPVKPAVVPKAPSVPQPVKAAAETGPTPATAVTSEQQPFATDNGLQSDQRIFTLKPGDAAELKLAMRKGARVNYRWSSAGGRINYDTHGDNATTSYYGYGKGRSVAADQGELVAAFDGDHGWFWRNRSGREVTVTLSTEGDYQSIKRIR